MKQRTLKEDVDTSKITFDLTSEDSFIVSFERLPDSRINDLATQYPDTVRKLMLKLATHAPSPYKLNRDGMVIPMSDKSILVNIKEFELYDVFKQLYASVLEFHFKGAGKNQDVKTSMDVEEDQPGGEFAGKVIDTDETSMTNEEIEIIKRKKTRDGYEYDIIIEDVSSYDDITILEDKIIDTLQIDNKCEILFEGINGELINANNDTIFAFSKQRKLTGYAKVFTPPMTLKESKQDLQVDSQLNKKRVIIESIKNRDLSLRDICAISYTITGRSYSVDNLYENVRSINRIIDEVEEAFKTVSAKRLNEAYHEVKKMKGEIEEYPNQALADFDLAGYGAIHEDESSPSFADAIVGKVETVELPKLETMAEIILEDDIDIENLHADGGKGVAERIASKIGEMNPQQLKKIYNTLKSKGLI